MAERLFRAIGRADMIDDPRFRTNADRVRNIEDCEAPIVAFISAAHARRERSRSSRRPRSRRRRSTTSTSSSPTRMCRRARSSSSCPTTRWARCRCTTSCRACRGRPATSARRRRRSASTRGEILGAALGFDAAARIDRLARTARVDHGSDDEPTARCPVWRSMLFVPVTVPKFVDGARRARRRRDHPRSRGQRARRREAARPRACCRTPPRRSRAAAPTSSCASTAPWRHGDARPRGRDLAARAGADADQDRERRARPDDRRGRRRARGRARHGARHDASSWRWSRPPAALFRMPRSRAPHPRLVALSLGAEDFALSVGMLPEAEGLFMPEAADASSRRAPPASCRSASSARSPTTSDLDAFRATIRRSRRLGFARRLRASTRRRLRSSTRSTRPSPDEVAQAERIVAAYDEAIARRASARSRSTAR